MIQLIAIIGALAGFVACVAYWVQPGPEEVRKKNRLRGVVFLCLGLFNLLFATLII